MTPIEMMLEGVTWVQTTGSSADNKDQDDGLPYATHEGVLDIMGNKFRCYRLNTGQAVFNADDVADFFGGAFTDGPDAAPSPSKEK